MISVSVVKELNKLFWILNDSQENIFFRKAASEVFLQEIEQVFIQQKILFSLRKISNHSRGMLRPSRISMMELFVKIVKPL